MNSEFTGELVARYGRELISHAFHWAAAAALILALALPGSRAGLRRFGGPNVGRITLVIVCVLAVVWGWRLMWLGDDAYISFRYADNLVSGNGLVFNPGERVEGYTNFLWTVLIAAFMAVGFDPGQVTIVLGLGSFVTVVVTTNRLAAALAERSEPVGSPVGIAAVLTAASYTMATYATSGLETMFAAALAILALERAERGQPFVAGLAGVGAAMAHPDHALFYAALAFSLLTFRDRWSQLVRYLVPFLVVFLPYFIWRWSYYGDLFPNTYYAKSADQPYYGQGASFIFATVLAAGLWAAIPLAAVGIWRSRGCLTGRYAVVALPIFLLYVASVGGDFMLGRLLVPVIGIVFVLVEVGARELGGTGRFALRKIATCALLVLAAVGAVPARVLRNGEKFFHLADERTFYPVTSFAPIVVESVYSRQAAALQSAFRHSTVIPKMALWCVGIVGYHTRFPIFDLYGLTNAAIAHTPIRTRGRPGHEKQGTPGQVLAAGVDLSEIPLYPPPFTDVGRVRIGDFTFYLVRNKTSLVEVLRESPENSDLPQRVDDLLSQGVDAGDALDRACLLWFLDEYHFACNADPGGRARSAERAAQLDSTLGGLEALLVGGADPAELGYRLIRRHSFDGPPAGQVEGDAFFDPRGESAAPGQAAVYGAQGRFVNSFHHRQGDRATGKLSLPSFVIEGDAITLRIGGGRAAAGVRVELIVDNRPVRTAAGCDSEILGRRVWGVSDLAGKRASILIVDQGTERHGHIVVDEIAEWAKAVGAR